MSIWQILSNPAIMVFLVPISVILVGGAIAIVKLYITHRERMAMIEQGMHPDSKKPGRENGEE